MYGAQSESRAPVSILKMTPEELIASNPDWLTGRDDAGYDHAVATQVLKAIMDGDAAALRDVLSLSPGAVNARCIPPDADVRYLPYPMTPIELVCTGPTDKGPCADHPLEKCLELLDVVLDCPEVDLHWGYECRSLLTNFLVHRDFVADDTALIREDGLPALSTEWSLAMAARILACPGFNPNLVAYQTEQIMITTPWKVEGYPTSNFWMTPLGVLVDLYVEVGERLYSAFIDMLLEHPHTNTDKAVPPPAQVVLASGHNPPHRCPLTPMDHVEQMIAIMSRKERPDHLSRALDLQQRFLYHRERKWRLVRWFVKIRPYALHWMEEYAKSTEKRRIKRAREGDVDDPLAESSDSDQPEKE